MDIQGLFRLDRSYEGRLIDLMSDCFMEDPLFLTLIPDEKIRKRLVPLYFESYLHYQFDYCRIYADSEALGGAVIYFDDTQHPASRVRYMLAGLLSGLMTALDVVRSDHTLKTAVSFLRGLRYLKSTWVGRAVHAPTVHIDFLAVRPSQRGKGLATRLMRPVLEYAESLSVPATLETHNQKNVAMYSHFGFQTVLEMSGLGLHQYCMVK